MTITLELSRPIFGIDDAFIREANDQKSGLLVIGLFGDSFYGDAF